MTKLDRNLIFKALILCIHNFFFHICSTFLCRTNINFLTNNYLTRNIFTNNAPDITTLDFLGKYCVSTNNEHDTTLMT